jgi:hypothetical protein
MIVSDFHTKNYLTILKCDIVVNIGHGVDLNCVKLMTPTEGMRMSFVGVFLF